MKKKLKPKQNTKENTKQNTKDYFPTSLILEALTENRTVRQHRGGGSEAEKSTGPEVYSHG